MLIPLGTDRPLRRPTLINHVLIGLCVATFIVDLLMQRFAPDTFALARQNLWLYGDDLKPWTFITYQFLHGGFLHLLGNMLFLYVFGPNLEDRLGRWWYLAFYLVGGAIAGGAHALWTPEAPVVGASGSISAVTGAFLVFFPRTIVRVFIFFFIIGVIQIPASWFIGFQIFLNIFYQGLGGDSNVAYLAHLGGYAYGFAVAFALLATGVIAREPYDLFSMGRQAKRRRAFRELTSKGHDPWGGRAPGRAHARRDSKADKKSEELAKRRAEVSEMISADDIAAAASLYAKLCDDFDRPTMSRDAQLALANYNMQHGEHTRAATAYEIFLEKHPRDSEAPHVQLLLALLYTRYLHRPNDATRLLTDLDDRLRTDDERTLAASLRQEAANNEVAS